MRAPTEEDEAGPFEPVLATPQNILGENESFLIYGPGGSGKTHTAHTAPQPTWTLTMGGKNELKTIFGKDFIKEHGQGEHYITSVKEMREKGQMVDNPPGYDYCCDALDRFLEWNDRKGIGTKTIIVDNGTVLEEYMMNKAIAAEYELAGKKEKTVLHAERNFGIRKPHDSTYGGAQSFMDRWMNWLKELPFHLVFVAHDYEQYAEVEEGGGRKPKILKAVRPLFVGAQRTSIQNKFDNVWYAMTQGGGRSQTWGMQTQRDQIIDAKTRVSGILDQIERDVNLTSVINEFKNYAHSLKPTE